MILKIEPTVERKMINGKQRLDWMLKFISFKKRTVYFIQADTNIWWKPRKIIKNFTDARGKSVGWLFVQMGYVTFNK
jgi:hypothetical protein